MISALVKTAVEEIAWEGSPGISWSHLIATLQQNGPLDAAVKSCLWKELGGRKDVIVRGVKNSTRALQRVAEPSDDSKILLDMPSMVRSHFLLLDAHPDVAENDLSRNALQLVAKSRAKGCSGASLSSQLGVNCRDLFYVLEGLRTAGLLVCVVPLAQKENACAKEASDMNVPGNLFVFSRFFDTENVEKNQIQALMQSSSSRLQNQILSALRLNSSSVCFEHDLKTVIWQSLEENSFTSSLKRRTVGKIYQRVRNDMVAAGDVECVRAWDHQNRHWRDALCIPGTHDKSQTESDQPIPVLAITQGQDDSVTDQHPSVESQTNHIPCSSLASAAPRVTLRVSERSFTQQVEDLIRCSSKFCNGITSPEVADSLGIRRKHCERILNDLVKRNRVLRVFESDGKTHLNRYFDVNHKEPPSASNKRPQSGGHPEKLAKHGKEAGSKRVDRTFLRRQQQLEVLLQARGVLTPVEVTKIAAEDAALGKMDRKTAKKLFKELAESNKNVGIAVQDTSPDAVQFAYWKPLHSKESARQVFDESVKLQEQTRFKKIRRDQTLALKNTCDTPSQPPVPVTALAISPVGATSAPRRQLPASVTAQNLRRLGRIQMLTTPQATLDQRILQHYGFLSAIVARMQLLHEMLLRKTNCNFKLQWTPSKIVDEMDLEIFLQVIGCGTYDESLDEILLGDSPFLVRDVPDELRRLLLGRSHNSGSLRSVHAVRRLMRHLAKLGLAESIGEEDQIKYQVLRFVHVPTFTDSGSSDPAGKFDLVQPNAVDAYWTCLQRQVEAWRNTLGSRGDSSSDDHDKQSDKAKCIEKSKDRRRRAMILPANAMVPEIFQSKNWAKSVWLTPRQRASMNDFYNDVHSKVESSNEQMQQVRIIPGRVLTPKSAEVMALSRQIMVPPDKIIKYCRHLTEVRGAHPSGNQVEFSSLLAVRFKCHLCGYLCFQRTSITEHYAKFHGEKLPEDESKFSEADFYAQRLEQAKPTKRDSMKRLRRQRVQNASPWPVAEGARSEDEGMEERWGAEPTDDSSWLQLFAIAESMCCLQQLSEGKAVQTRPVGCEVRTDASTWPMLSRLSGRSAAYCRSRLQGLLSQDVKNRRTVAALRSAEMQAESGFMSMGMKGNIGRAVAKSLLLTSHEAPAYWWRTGFLNADVKTMVDCVIRRWQCDGLVSKYKERCTKLPPRARPSWILTWFSRSRMFGKGSDLPRWQDVLSLLLGSQSIVRKMLPESSDGAQLLVLSGAVASDSASLCADWGDVDFYRQSISATPPWFQPVEQSDEEEEIEEVGTSRSQQGGIQSHLQLTSEEPTLKSVLVSFSPQRIKSAAQFFSFLSLRNEELSKIAGGANEPINPQMQHYGSGDPVEATQELRKDEEENENEENEEKDGENEENDDSEGENGHESTGSGSATQDGSCQVSATFPVSTMCAAFAAYVDGSWRPGKVADLLRAAVFVFKSVVETGDPSDRGLLPGLGLAELKEMYEKATDGVGEVSLFHSLQCLEDLRLLVPFPCGEDFRLVLAHAAAPYCLRQAEAEKESKESKSKELLESLLRGFQQNSFGRHWLPSDLPQDSLRAAAAYIVHTAKVADGGMLERWLLPPGLVAPCAWVNAKGQLNILVLRCLLSRLMQLLLREPLTSAAELVQHLGILDTCEVEYLLEFAVYMGAADRFNKNGKASETMASYQVEGARYRCAFLR